MRITIDKNCYFEGDACQFSFFDANKKYSCSDMASVKRMYSTISQTPCTLLDEVVAKDKEIEAEIVSLCAWKMINKVNFDDGFFIEFDKDVFCLESIRPQRIDKSKNHGHFGRWHLHYAVITYKNRAITHSKDINTKEALLLLLDSILIGIKSAFSKIEVVDQGKPIGLMPNVPKSIESSSSGPKTKFLFK